MRILLLAIVIIVCALIWEVYGAEARLSVETKLRNSQSVVNWYEHQGAWTLRPGFQLCQEIRSSKAAGRCYRHRQGYRFHLARVRRLDPPNIQEYVQRHHPCLHGIIRWENRTYDPTLDYGGGHGNVEEPYGIPQANPGTKMSSAGADWRTNPWTQLKWMIGYAVGRYGSECGALAHRLSHGWY